jgi:hypothetical protein
VDPHGYERATNPNSSGAAGVGFCGRDLDAERDIYQENVVCEYPQSSERIHGNEKLKSLRGHHPGRPGGFIVRRISCS